MDTKELLKKVRKIEIKTKGLSAQIFSGEYHSAFKGRGMAFSEVREYTPGDEIRTIDWNVTARFNHPYVKVFQEERELSVMLIVDVSGSSSFGSDHQLKKDLIAELSAVLAFSATQNNDKVGLLLFSDQPELFIPPKKGRKHILRIIRELLEYEPRSAKTDLSEALTYLNNLVKKRSIAFILSDFISPDYEKALKITARKHDVVALQITDPLEYDLPNIGLVQVMDSETGTSKWISTNSNESRKAYSKAAFDKDNEIIALMQRSGVDHVKLSTNEKYVTKLMGLFKNR